MCDNWSSDAEDESIRNQCEIAHIHSANETVAVVGSIAALGNWNPDQSQKLNSSLGE